MTTDCRTVPLSLRSQEAPCLTQPQPSYAVMTMLSGHNRERRKTVPRYRHNILTPDPAVYGTHGEFAS